jgi:hypothetical protein
MSLQQTLQTFTFHGKGIPEYMQYDLVSYLEHKIMPGDFLLHVLSNNLRGAIQAADDHNLWLVPVYVAFLYNHADSRAWGSKEKVEVWLDPNR